MTENKLQEIRLEKRGITTTSPTPPWCGCGGYGGHSRLGRSHSGGVKRLSTARHPRGVAPPQPDTTWCGCGGCTVVRPPPQWWFGGEQPLMDQKQGPKLTTKLNIVFTLDVTTMHEKYRQDPEVSRCFMGCSTVVLADPHPQPATAAGKVAAAAVVAAVAWEDGGTRLNG
ncbi:hypothetical protein Tco_0123961 [Tanacetum coccineum]